MESDELRLIADALGRVLRDEELPEDMLYALTDIDTPEGKEALLDAAAEITRQKASKTFDYCSIINARSGRCPENCRWCAQSAHFSTGCGVTDVVSDEEALEVSRYNADRGVGRFSLVTSGRATRGKDLEDVCRVCGEINREGRIGTCASLGLLDADALQRLWDSGVHRYHCNLETAPSFFPSLCSTHTQADKLATIEAARKIGFEVCSGGIIGMGETRRQRMELAIALRAIRPASIPLNILIPIPGTPLEHTPLISEEEVLLAVAYFRFAHPAVQLRFAGGRARLSRATVLRAMRSGINGAIVGDLLTTLGSTIAQDKELVKEAGYE